MNQPSDPEASADLAASRRVAVACVAFSLSIVPLGFAMMVGAIPLAMRRLRDAAHPYERCYWGCNAAGHLMIACGALLLLLLAIDDTHAASWKAAPWRLLSSLRIGPDAVDPVLMPLLALMLLLAAGLALLCLARLCGRTDENDVWHPPDRR